MIKIDQGSFRPIELDPDVLAISDRLSALSLNDIGLMEARDGHHSRAIFYFHKAIKKSQEHAFIYSNYALSLRDLGHFADAMRLLEHAITLETKNPTLFFNLANLQYETGQLDAALASYDRAVRLNGAFADLFANYALAALEVQEYALALRLAQRGLELAERTEPNFVRLTGVLATIDVIMGVTKQALLRLEDVLSHNQSTDAIFEYARVLAIAAPEDLSPQSLKYISQAIEERWIAPEEFVHSAWLFLIGNYGFPTSQDNQTWSHLGCLLLSAALIPDLETERWLIEKRNELSAFDKSKPLSSQDIELYAAISQQCFLRNYLFERNEEQDQLAFKLKAKLEKHLAQNEQVPTLELLSYARLEPLAKLNYSERLLILTKESAELSALIKQQVENPLRELQIEKTIPRVTTRIETKDCITDRYSQYPYPQWTWPGKLYRPERFNIYLAQRLGHSRFSQLKAASMTRILVAGCGTGRHSHLLARTVSDAEIKALDVSRPSLAFAKRQAADDGVCNIEYLEADITAIDSWPQRFEVIECAGVLHHLQDPAEGLRSLVSLLKPKGLILLGLYSRRARRSILTLRQRCEDQFKAVSCVTDPSLDKKLHLARSIVIEDHDFSEILRFRDFYSYNECLDLLLNPREWLFSPVEIKDLLQSQKLIFRGFELNPAQRTLFRIRNRGESDLLDLDLWEQFEAENPETFAEMYHFWAERAD